ncbi:polyketide synthase [Runella salmonicolor]|uniref:Amino acid adenylation domain-containing protein n=1 Tax=Runella salmonicolor TaxID=2950278 RepID=A0ABT1FXM2_9BACT|nr:polyketide synthase [Runella salmonicolor]MCP1386526.1 amino acid adenylation domain-containing protein [Runella salmonicolor]
MTLPDQPSLYTVIDFFLKQLTISKDAVAIQYQNQQLTYRELAEKVFTLSSKIAHIPEKTIVVSASRSIDMIVYVLAALHAGKAYLPLDTSYPLERLKQILKEADVRTGLYSTEEETIFNQKLNIINVLSAEEIAPQYPSLASTVTYVLYTSGSTGVPKGVSMGNEALINLIQWQKNNSRCGEGTKTLQFSPLGFDVSFQEIFATLSTGGTLVLIDDDQRLNPLGLLEFIAAQRINRIFLPFVALQLLAETAVSNQYFPSSLKEVITAGEQLKITPQLRAFFSALPNCQLFNQYGPTECHVVTQLALDGPPDSWPELPSIGTPIDNVSIFILDEQLHPVADGTEGELCIGGVCVAEGYLNQPKLTAEKFQQWQPPQGSPQRIYRTGDVARKLPDGNFEFLGRKDDQVKIRGYRIELGEIEAALTKLPNVTQAVVTVNKDIPGQNRLIAYFTSDKEEQELPLRNQLADLLPDYMVPSGFVRVSEFKRTPNGKVNRKSLPKPSLQRPALQVPYRKPTTLIEQQTVALWEELLLLEHLGADDSFFELGGNSLLAQKTVVLLQQRYGYQLPITKLYQFPTPSGISIFLAGNEKKFELPAAPFSDTKQKDVAIIGMACRFPGADTIDEFWNILVNGQETVRFFTPQELNKNIPDTLKRDPSYVPVRGIIDGIKEFDADFFGIPPRMAEVMDPQQRIFLEIAYEVLENTGYLLNNRNQSVGVFAGCGNNTYYLNNVFPNKNKLETIGQFQVNTVSEKDYIATRTAYQLNLQGPAVGVFSACSTSLLAVAEATESIRTGKCRVAIAGGASITAPVESGHLYQEGAMFSQDGHTRSFDAHATGTVFSDGAGVVLLKSLDEAKRDGDFIYAVIKGTGVNNDGGEKGSFTAPSAHGQAIAIALALRDAAVNPATISYIEAHGTATPIGDPIEIEGLKMAFGPQEHNHFCAIGSVKSNIGHLTHAAGVAGLIKTALSMQHGVLPASINYQTPNPALELETGPFYVNDRLNEWKGEKKRAGISSFGVGGTNVHVVVESYPAPVPVPQPTEDDWQLITWSAHSEQSATEYGQKLATYLNNHPTLSLASVGATLRATRKEYLFKRFAVAKDAAGLQAAMQQPTPPTHAAAVTDSSEVMFVFPGQGTHYPFMGRELYVRFPVFREALEACRAILMTQTGRDILEVLYPEKEKPSSETVDNTLYAQPALFSVSYALATLWMSLGIKPQAFIGHSLGEFVAAHLAGVFSLEDALKLVATRATMVSALPQGAMLAVRIPAERVADLLEEGISHALINSPNNHVFSGTPEKISRLTEKVATLGFAHAPVNTTHAFHSAAMDPVVAPFQRVVASVTLNPPRIPIISSVTSTYLKDSEATSPSYWANHLRATVRFSEAIAFAAQESNPIFLETGPGGVLSSYIKQQNKRWVALESITAASPETKQLLQALGKLWQLGLKPNWNGINDASLPKIPTLPTYAFQRKRLWLEPIITEQPINSFVINPPEITPIIDNTPLPVNRSALLSEKIRQILENALGIELGDTDEKRSFIDLGVDSLLLTQLSLTLKKEFSIPVSFRQLSEEYDSIPALVAYLDQQLPAEKFTPAPVHTPAPAAVRPMLPQVVANTGPLTALDQIAQQLQVLTQQVQLLQANGSTPQASPSVPTVASPPPLTPLSISPDEAAELKKPFGATARIERQKTTLNDTQKNFIRAFTADYNHKTAKSKEYTQKHRASMADPRVVTGFKPVIKEIVYPIVVSSSKGSRVKDIDGNEYIDALNGFGSNMLGYQPEVLTRAIKEQMDKGYEIGPQHELSGPVCDLICEFTGFDRAALCNTGSEAVLGAMRIARTVTGRSLIVAFTGSYHGINDEVIVRATKSGKNFPAAPGIMPEAVQNMLILDYGTDESLRIISERADELAAVLVEPVQSRRPEFQPVDFLKKVRQITAMSGSVLIFDEVITGFRAHSGGAQALFGIQADLGTYGKVIGGGLPIGAIAGKKAFMDALDGGFWQYGDESIPEAGVTYFAGTFVRHPLALAAAKASLEYMKEKGAALQNELNEKTVYLVQKLNDVCQRHHIPLYGVHFGSLWKLKLKEEYPYNELVFALMRSKGIHIWENFPCFLTEAHTKDDIDQIIAQFEQSVQELIDAELIPVPKKKKEVTLRIDDNQPPVMGAQLGLDSEGNPAWFITDAQRPGKYLKIEP